MSYKQGSQIDTDYRIQQIQPVDGRDIEVGHEQFPDLINDPVEHIGSHCREEAHEETKQKGELLIGNMLLTPLQETLQGRVMTDIGMLICHFLIIVTTPSRVSLMMLDGVWGLCSCRRDIHT